MHHDIMRFAQVAVRVWGCDMDYTCPERTAKEGIKRFRQFLSSIGMPINFEQIGAKEEDIPKLLEQLQIRGRNLTAGEERYAQQWLDWGFDEEAIAMAYERTCLNTGGLNWAYMNKILQRWHSQGLHTAEEVRSGDQRGIVPKGASGQLGTAELEAIQRVLREG